MKKLLIAIILLCSVAAFGQASVPRYELVTATGTNTYSVTVTPTPSLVNGFKFQIKFTNANSGASTLNVSGLGAVTLRKHDGTALSSGDIAAGSDWWAVYDGTAAQWRLLGGGSGATEWGDITGTLSNQTDLQTELNSKQAGDADLTSWAGVTRGSGFDTWAATPSWTNFNSMITGTSPFWNAGGTTTLTSANTIVGTNTNTWKAIFDNLGTTQTNGGGLWLANTQSASTGAQQISPSLVLEGQGWKTDATAASRSVKWAIDNLPVQGTSNPTSILQFRHSTNNGAYGNAVLNLLSSGTWTSTIAAGARSLIRWDLSGQTMEFFGPNSSNGIIWRSSIDSHQFVIGTSTTVGGATFHKLNVLAGPGSNFNGSSRIGMSGTGQATSEIIDNQFVGSAYTISGGGYTTQRFNTMTGYAISGLSGATASVTNTATLYLDVPKASHGGQTNASSGSISGRAVGLEIAATSLIASGTGTVASGYGAYINAPTGATNNYALAALGNTSLFRGAGTTTDKIVQFENSAGTERFSITGEGVATITGRMNHAQGADVASVAGAITLGTDGNAFEITGTNAITLISNLNWQNAAEITLVFASTATLVDGTANSGTDIGIELNGNTNFTAATGQTIKLQLLEQGGTQRWREVSRSLN